MPTSRRLTPRGRSCRASLPSEERLLPPDLDYQQVSCLRLEARQKLSDIRPASLGQASRISGVSPADIATLMVYLESREGQK